MLPGELYGYQNKEMLKLIINMVTINFEELEGNIEQYNKIYKCDDSRNTFVNNNKLIQHYKYNVYCNTMKELRKHTLKKMQERKL